MAAGKAPLKQAVRLWEARWRVISSRAAFHTPAIERAPGASGGPGLLLPRCYPRPVERPINPYFIGVSQLAILCGNVTGFGILEASLAGKWLELLSEIAPGLKRAAIMFHADIGPVSTYMPLFETAARSLKVAPITAPVRSHEEIETAIIALGREPGGGLVVMPDVFLGGHRAPIILAAARNNVPAVYPSSSFARDGGLFSYGTDVVDNYRRAATYVDRILRGEKPGDLPVQFPTKFEMIVNRKTAKALGLAVPPSIMLRADEVIE
jgi:putative ABC transport system substrate-binding protein